MNAYYCTTILYKVTFDTFLMKLKEWQIMSDIQQKNQKFEKNDSIWITEFNDSHIIAC